MSQIRLFIAGIVPFFLFFILLNLNSIHAQSIKAGWLLTTDSIQCLNRNMFFGDDTSIVLSASYTKTWYYGDGDSCHCIHANHVYKQPGTYEIKLVIYDNGQKDSMSHYVIVLPSARPAYTVNAYFQCLSDNTFILEDTVGVSYQAERRWIWGDGYTDTSKISVHSYSQPGDYLPSLVYLYSNGCNDTNASFTLEVYPSILAKIKFSADQVCEDNVDLTFINSSIIDTSLTYTHFFSGNLFNSTSDTIHINHAAPGLYKIYLTDTSSNGCLSIDSAEIKVDRKASPVWTMPLSKICGNDSITLSVYGSLSDTILWDSLYYIFYKNGTQIQSDTSPYLYGVYSEGNYQCKITHGLCSDTTNMIHIYKFIPVRPELKYFSGKLTVQGVTGKCQWFRDGQLISGITGLEYIPVTGGIYFVSAEDSNGCNAFSDSISIALGINSQLYSIRIYPNPSEGNFMIQSTGGMLNFYNYAGEKVITYFLTSGEQNVATSLTNGLYLVELISSEKIVYGYLQIIR